ncbi:30S ribosome-binding factor RbfA [Mycoplasma sp. SG1]|uniref:30S ribosome-binding factor RbfA n=1 Tax=Mycoplasma sp. SG1 TaxID=2810348 RepID=UPI0020253C2C|nr:30S ribosome-binding factor RbfA [Mycoplasma sp. SG1]URM53222.1 30S ribosome-binding factor RbfA [Mycoplasma sp. SG1]
MANNTSPYRQEKLISQITRTLAEIINNDVTNANVKFITISSLKVSKDKRNITVFFTTFYNRNKAETGLNNASSFIAKRLAVMLGLSPYTRIKFSFDDQTKKAFDIDKIIEDAEK